MEDDEWANKIRADARVHQPSGMVVEDVELVDEDGVVLTESIVHLLGTIAQHGGYAFENLYRIALLFPRNFSAVESNKEKFSDKREFRMVRNDTELAHLIRAWQTPKYSKARIRSQRTQALAKIHAKLSKRILDYATLENEEEKKESLDEFNELDEDDMDAEQEDHARSEELAYDDIKALQSLWELALYKGNYKVILSGKHDVIGQLAELIGMESREFEGVVATNLTGTLWAMAQNKSARERLVSLSLVPLVFTVLYQKNLLYLHDPPKSHVYALGALRSLLETEENHRFLLDSPAKYDIDLLKFVAFSMYSTTNREVWDHLAAILLRCLLRSPESISAFLEDYANFGQPNKIVQYFTENLEDVTRDNSIRDAKFQRRSSAASLRETLRNEEAAANGSTSSSPSLAMNAGSRLAISLLLSNLAISNVSGRELLLSNQTESDNKVVQSLLRWAIHSVASGESGSSGLGLVSPATYAMGNKLQSFREERPASAASDHSLEDLGSGTTLSGKAFSNDFPTTFDAFWSLLIPSLANPHPKASKRNARASVKRITTSEDLESSTVTTTHGDQTWKLSSSKEILRSPDLDSNETTYFNQSEWNMPSGKAHEATLMNAALALWGLLKAVSEKPSSTQSPSVSQHHRQLHPSPSSLQNPETVHDQLEFVPVDIKIGTFCVSSVPSILDLRNAATFRLESSMAFSSDGDLTQDLLASAISLALSCRREGDQKPAVEICAMSALNALAHAQSPAVRQQMIRLHPQVYQPYLSQIGQSAEGDWLTDDLVWKERNTELGAFFSKCLTEALVSPGSMNLHHPSLESPLCAAPTSNQTSRAYGISALVGTLETCTNLGISPSAAFPYLDIKDILLLCSNVVSVSAPKSPSVLDSSKTASSRSKRSFFNASMRRKSFARTPREKLQHSSSQIMRNLASACVMLHALRPKCPTPDSHETDPMSFFPQWNRQACQVLLQILDGAPVTAHEQGVLEPQPTMRDFGSFKPNSMRSEGSSRTVVQAPSGFNLAYLAIACWSLGREYPLRMTMLKLGFLPALIRASHQTIEMISVYREAYLKVSKNETNIVKLQHETKRSLRRVTVTKDVKESTAEARARHLACTKEHLFALNALLSAIWQLVMNRDMFSATALSNNKITTLMFNLDRLDDERAILRKARTELFKLLLRVIQAVCIGRKPTSKQEAEHVGVFTFVYAKHKDIIDSIAEKTFSTLWALASLRISDKAICDPTLIQFVLDFVYNENVKPETRCLVAHMLCYIDRLPPRSELSTSIRSRLEQMISPTYLCEIVIHLLGSDIELLRSNGADLLGKVRTTKMGQALVRDSNGINLLLNLTRTASSEHVVCNALKGLRHVALDETSQVNLCRQGLYHLLELSWTTPIQEHRRILALILKQLAENAQNKTRMYKAELRARQMLGWRNIQDPTDEERAQFREQLSRFRNGVVGPTRGSTIQGKKETNLKNDFMEWLDALHVEQSNMDVARSLLQTRRVKVPRNIHSKRPSFRDERSGNRFSDDAYDHLLHDPEDFEEKNHDDNDSESGKTLQRTLSSFLRDVRKEVAEEAAGKSKTGDATSPKTSHRSKAKADLQVVIPTLTANGVESLDMTKGSSSSKPHKPDGTKGKSSPTSPRSLKFKVRSPVESPLWNLRNDIHFPGKEEEEEPNMHVQSARSSTQRAGPPISRRGSVDSAADDEDLPMKHSSHSPFTASEHRNASMQLSKRMCKPARALWAPDSLYTNVGKERWNPKVEEITTRTPEQIAKDKEKLRASSSSSKSSSPKSTTAATEVGGVELTEKEGEDASQEGASAPLTLAEKRVEEIRVKMESTRPYTQFIFNRDGDPFSALKSWEEFQVEGSDSETSLSSFNSEDSFSSDEEVQSDLEEEDGKQVRFQAAKKNKKSDQAKQEDLEKVKSRQERLERKKIRQARRRQVRERERRLRQLNKPKRVCMSKFDHIEGAKVYDDLPKYKLPNGKEIFLYLSGGPMFGKDRLEDVNPPPLAPFQVEELSFPNKTLPFVPKLLSEAQYLPCKDSGRLPAPLVPAPFPETHSLAMFNGRQPETSVSWTRGGRVLDEPIPMFTLPKEDVVGGYEEEVIEEDPWSVEKSVFAARGKMLDTFYNDKQSRNVAFENDWQLCEQKRTFRKLLSRYTEQAINDLQGILKQNYGLICNVFRYYSSLDQIQSIFAMQMLEFTDLCNHANIRETSPDSLIQEGHCNTIFIQVTKNPIEDWTEEQLLFERECTILSLKKSSQLMRYQFLEALVRVAEAKYVKSHQVIDISSGMKRLFQTMLDVPAIKRIDGCFDDFRRKRLYCESVDDVLRANLGFLKDMFLQFAGTSPHSKDHGGCKGKRMTYEEWQSMLLSIGMFNPLFTLRESNTIYRSSTLDVDDEVIHWRRLVALTFVDFLEAIARASMAMVIPSTDELEEVGADDIVDYYRIMESTGLWLIINEKVNSVEDESAESNNNNNNDGRDPLDDGEKDSSDSALILQDSLERKSKLTLDKRLEQFILLLRHMKERSERMRLEERLWKADPKKMLEEQSQRQEEEQKQLLQSIKNRKKVTSSGMVPTVLRAQQKAKSGGINGGDEEEVEEQLDSLALALAAVEDGIPMDRFEAHVAATLHDVWRENRGKLSDGLFNPRVKVIKGVEYDIANLPFAKLPGHFQMENLLAAHDACESLRHAFESWEKEELPIEVFFDRVESMAFLEEASASQHEHWLKRNSKKSWVEPQQKVSWKELSEEDKDKNRDIVRTAVKVWVAHQTKRKTIGKAQSSRFLKRVSSKAVLGRTTDNETTS